MFSFISRRRPAVAGLIIGVIVGLMVAIGYGATSAWLCSGIRDCPVSWEPFVFISLLIFLVIVVAMVVVAMVFARAYKIFDTSIGGSKAYEPSIGSNTAPAEGSDE